MVEALLVVSIIGIIALIMVPIATKIRPAAEETKVQLGVSQINSAIKGYLASGGSLDGVVAADVVVAHLKTKMSSAKASTFVGFTGATIDQRLITVPVGVNDDGARAVYDSARKKFVLTKDKVVGVRFDLDDEYEGNGIAAVEARKTGVYEYSNDGSWVWDYTDAAKENPLDIASVTEVAPTAPIPVALLPTSAPESPDSPELKKLLPPSFSLASGHYDVSDYPMSLEIINPNEAGKIVYGIVSSGSWGWNEYTDPIVVNPGMEIVAFVKSWRPQQYHNSSTTHALYDWSDSLNSPDIYLSESVISKVDGVTTVTINHDNDPDFYISSGVAMSGDPFEVRYRVVPKVDGSGIETAWLSYSSPFSLSGAEFPDGFDIYAKVISSVANLDESYPDSASVTTFDPEDLIASELEFTTTGVSLETGDSFNIRDYVQIKGDPGAEVDWAQLYFTYTEAGANNPTSPGDWNLGAFNGGSAVTVTESDSAPGTGNGSGDGEYTVYLVRNGEAGFDASLTITVTDPGEPGEGLPKLLPPEFSPSGGYFEGSSFPVSITLTDPNPAGEGKIVYTINGATADYTGPFSVEADTEVAAYVEAVDPTTHNNSSTVVQNYNLSVQPWGPWVWVSNSEIEVNSGSTKVYMGYKNTSHISFDLQYKLVPLVPGEGAETEWTSYNGSFSVGAPQFPRGFDVASKIVPSENVFPEVDGETETVTTYYQLDSPEILSSVEAINDKDPEATITLNNPNPAGSSTLEYQILNMEGSAETGWAAYTSPFVVAGADYPNGVIISAKATSTDSFYRESSPAEKAIAGKFFDIDVTWNTIFVLDSSGSMTTNGRMTGLKSQVNAVLQEFGEDDNFAVVQYGDGAGVVSPWGPGTESRVQAAQAAVDGMTPGGATNYHAALESVLALSAANATQVIFLSDGLPFAPDEPDPENTDGILELVTQIVSSGVERLDTIALGISSEILVEMANSGGGQSVVVPD